MGLGGKYMVSTFCVLSVLMGYIFFSIFKISEKEIRDGDQETAILITDVIKNGLIAIMLEDLNKSHKAKDFQRFLELIFSSEDVTDAKFFDSNGIILLSGDPSLIGKTVTDREKALFKDKKSSIQIYSEETGSLPFYSMTLLIFNERPCQRCHGADNELKWALNVKTSIKRSMELIGTLRLKIIMYYLISVLLPTIFLGLITVFLVKEPIDTLIDTVKKAEYKDFDIRFITDRKDDVGRLAESLNYMMSKVLIFKDELEKNYTDEMHRVEKMAVFGELASAIAHEIKNPLAGISGAMQVFLEDIPESDPRREIINEVLTEIEHLDKAIKEMLIFARPPDIHPVMAEIMSIIEQAAGSVQAQAKKQNVEIKIDSAGTIEISVDPQQIKQVFLNIMLNALQAMPGGGTLTVTVSFVSARNECEVLFTDTGVGIKPEDIKNVFNPFFTVRNRLTGLGLAISKNIVEQHNGKVKVESQIGVGSTYKVILPKRG